MCLLYSIIIIVVLLAIYVFSAYTIGYQYGPPLGVMVREAMLQGLKSNLLLLVAVCAPIVAGEYYARNFNCKSKSE